MAKPKIAVFSGPTSTIANSPTLVTSNKGRLPGERILSGRYGHLAAQLLYEPVTVRIKKYSAHPLEEDAKASYHDDGKEYYEVELRPEDPIINDHLGDAYWWVGRDDEARFQWQRALGLNPKPDIAANLHEKIKRGLIKKSKDGDDG